MTFKVEEEECVLQRSSVDESLWRVLNTSGELRGLVAPYVDDFLVSAPEKVIHSFFSALKQKYKLGLEEIAPWGSNKEITYIGFNIRMTEKGILLNQRKYVESLLIKHNDKLKNSKGARNTPSQEDLERLPLEEDISQTDIHEAQISVGEALWLSIRTRVDIAYTVHWMASNICTRPRAVQEIYKQVLNYLKGTPGLGLFYTSFDDYDSGDPPTAYDDLRVRRGQEKRLPTGRVVVRTYADASFAPGASLSHKYETEEQRTKADEDNDSNIKSISGLVTSLGGNVVSWQSKKQQAVASSSCEAELVAQVSATQMAIGLKALLSEICQVSAITMCDARATIGTIAGESKVSNRHMSYRAGYVRSQLLATDLDDSCWVGTKDQMADGLTKPLSRQKFQEMVVQLKMRDDSDFLVMRGAEKVCSEVISKWDEQQSAPYKAQSLELVQVAVEAATPALKTVGRILAEKVVAGTIAFITAGSTVQEEEQTNLKLEEEEQMNLKTEEEETDEEEEQEDLRKQTKTEEHKHTTNATLSGAITGGLVVLGAQGIYHKVRKLCGRKRRVTVTTTTRDVCVQSPCTYDLQRHKFKYLGSAHANEFCVLAQQPKETTKQVEGL